MAGDLGWVGRGDEARVVDGGCVTGEVRGVSVGEECEVVDACWGWRWAGLPDGDRNAGARVGGRSP